MSSLHCPSSDIARGNRLEEYIIRLLFPNITRHYCQGSRAWIEDLAIAIRSCRFLSCHWSVHQKISSCGRRTGPPDQCSASSTLASALFFRASSLLVASSGLPWSAVLHWKNDVRLYHYICLTWLLTSPLWIFSASIMHLSQMVKPWTWTIQSRVDGSCSRQWFACEIQVLQRGLWVIRWSCEGRQKQGFRV